MEAGPSTAETASFGQEHFLRWSGLVREMPEPQQIRATVHHNRAHYNYYLLWLGVIELWNEKLSLAAALSLWHFPLLLFKKVLRFFFFLLSLEPMSSKIEKTSYSFLILLIHALHPAAPLCSFTLLKRDKKMLYKKKLSTGQVAKFSRCFVLLWSWQRSLNCLETSLNSSINLIIG